MSKCIFCDGVDVHDCPGGSCTVRHDGAFSVGSGQMDVFPGKLDARAFQPPKYETSLSIKRDYESWRITYIAPDCPEYVKRYLQKFCDVENAEDDDKPRGGFEFL